MISASDLLNRLPGRTAPPALSSLFILLAAWLALLPLLALGLPMPAAVLAQGVVAYALSRWLGLPGWWQWINLVFCPLAWFVSGSGIDPRWFLAGFAVLAVTSLGSLWTRVPLYLSSRRAVKEIAARLPDRAGLRVIDLGSGLGGLLAGLARMRPSATLEGVEMAPLNWLIGRIRLGSRAHIRLGNLWHVDLSAYDVVYAYLSPAPMARLWEKVQAEMRPGSLFVSNSFTVPGIQPDETVELHDMNDSRLLIWRR